MIFNFSSSSAYNSTLVATGYSRGLVYDHNSGVNSSTPGYVYRAYLYDITSNTLSSNAVSATSNTITFYDTNRSFSNTANAYFYGVNDTQNTNITNADGKAQAAFDKANTSATIADILALSIALG